MAKKPASVKTQKMITDIAVHIFLAIVAVVWLIPFIWLVAHSFRAESTGQFTPGFFPKEYTIMNYVKLFTETDSMNFPRTFMNTFFIACCACVISTFSVLAVSYSLSRVKWKLRKSYMDMGMIINLFPGFMGMVAVYFLLKAMGLHVVIVVHELVARGDHFAQDGLDLGGHGCQALGMDPARVSTDTDVLATHGVMEGDGRVGILDDPIVAEMGDVGLQTIGLEPLGHPVGLVAADTRELDVLVADVSHLLHGLVQTVQVAAEVTDGEKLCSDLHISILLYFLLRAHTVRSYAFRRNTYASMMAFSLLTAQSNASRPSLKASPPTSLRAPSCSRPARPTNSPR